jgi:hypothetical protein
MMFFYSSVYILIMPTTDLVILMLFSPQAALFSGTVTAFIIDSKQNLKVNPAEQTVYYLQQHSLLLAQISQQISSIAPLVSIPSPPPPPFPSFNPSKPDIVVLVNSCWFLSLIFSLFAALFALIIQRCARDYMDVFQRYGDPLKRARLRQYIYEGWQKWSMPFLAECVQVYLHISFFLFFGGLCSAVSNLNGRVAGLAIGAIGSASLCYLIVVVSPLIYPQSPYKTAFTGIIWTMFQISRPRTHKDRNFNIVMNTASAIMLEGQLDIAMEETAERKGRDERAVRWLTYDLTEEIEMDSLVKAIPGSFNVDWGLEVWKKASSTIKDEESKSGAEPLVEPTIPAALPTVVRTSSTNTSVSLHTLYSRSTTSLTRLQEGGTVFDLSRRVAGLLETCYNPRLFRDEGEWRNRTRACVETTVSLVCCANAKLVWFGDITKLLGDIGRDQTIRTSSSEGRDQLFVTHWTCLSLMATRPVLENSKSLRELTSEKGLSTISKGTYHWQ